MKKKYIKPVITIHGTSGLLLLETLVLSDTGVNTGYANKRHEEEEAYEEEEMQELIIHMMADGKNNNTLW